MLFWIILGSLLALSNAQLHIVYAVTPDSLYHTEGVPQSIESVQSTATCQVDVHVVTQLKNIPEEIQGLWQVKAVQKHALQWSQKEAHIGAWMRYWAIEHVAKQLDYNTWFWYLDADVLVQCDLCGVSIASEATLAAAPMSGYRISDSQFFNRALLMRKYTIRDVSRDGFNNGVLLIHAGRWLERKCLERIVEWQRRNVNEDAPLFYYDDMAAINMALRDEWAKLEGKYNCLGYARRNEEERQGCCIAHYSGEEKFWKGKGTNTENYCTSVEQIDHYLVE